MIPDMRKGRRMGILIVPQTTKRKNLEQDGLDFSLLSPFMEGTA